MNEIYFISQDLATVVPNLEPAGLDILSVSLDLKLLHLNVREDDNAIVLNPVHNSFYSVASCCPSIPYPIVASRLLKKLFFV